MISRWQRWDVGGWRNRSIAWPLYALGMIALCWGLLLPATAQAHSVSLSCTPSTTTTVTGYFFYRSTVSGSGYAKLNSTPVSSCSFTDTTVQANTTYFYVATAFDPGASPSESTFSNQVSAVIPPNPQPNPPSGLTLGAVAMNVSDGKATLSAAWSDSPKNGTQWWSVFDYYGHAVARGSAIADSSGGYSVVANFTAPGKYPLTFQVCDRVACKDKNVSPS